MKRMLERMTSSPLPRRECDSDRSRLSSCSAPAVSTTYRPDYYHFFFFFARIPAGYNRDVHVDRASRNEPPANPPIPRVLFHRLERACRQRLCIPSRIPPPKILVSVELSQAEDPKRRAPLLLHPSLLRARLARQVQQPAPRHLCVLQTARRADRAYEGLALDELGLEHRRGEGAHGLLEGADGLGYGAVEFPVPGAAEGDEGVGERGDPRHVGAVGFVDGGRDGRGRGRGRGGVWGGGHVGNEYPRILMFVSGGLGWGGGEGLGSLSTLRRY